MSQLLPIGQIFITVPVDSPRALPSQELADYLRRQGAEVHPCGSLEEGVQAALSLARSDEMICACGSLYMIGSLRHLLLPE